MTTHYQAPIRVLGVLAIAAIVYGLAWAVLRPPTDVVKTADAVVVLAGPKARLRTGLDLVEKGVAPHLVLSKVRVDHDTARQVSRLCARGRVPRDVSVTCFEPEPQATRGEVTAIARLARQRDWNELTVVTSTYHILRTRLLLRQCFGGQLSMVGAGNPSKRLQLVRVTLREMAALPTALTVWRAC